MFFLFREVERIFELMIKESGGEGGDGKGITPCSRSALVPIIPPLSLLACLQYPALKVPLSLGKDCGGGRRENQLITPRLEKIDSFLSVE